MSEVKALVAKLNFSITFHGSVPLPLAVKQLEFGMSDVLMSNSKIAWCH